ncbi:MAG TPA: sugar-binding transcriptional regulator [Aggregatilineales bacterium]|nr:sugar-binding transcriptional regulator [Aggregatilineales bacterium]
MNSIDPHIARLIEVARAYYLENQTQAEIARSLGISRSRVSRHLTAAREMGLVEIRIVAPEKNASIQAQQLQRRYPALKEVIVAPTFSEDPDAIRAMIGRFAANYLVSIIQPGQHLALGCGRTLRAMVEVMQKRSLSDVIVVQAMGNIGHEAHQIDYNEIARKAAEILDGQVYYVSAPAILGIGSGRASDLIDANPTLQYSLSLARNADIYVVGLGSLESDQLYARVGLIQNDELEALRNHAIGDICGRFFDMNGERQPSPFDDRIVGIELEDLSRATCAIGVAGGRDKALPLLGALRGGFINVVITDERTLQYILQIDQSAEGG